ncbi:MAG TPA: M24 family metallopeptidase [Stellaceae bacterium]|nr:M24 family metallopeptidase [Stellaceae bacterium]HYC12803.1 M24 family metallopeptidase [Stellaceae bacterium]
MSGVPVRLRSLYREDYPRFSDEEMQRRRHEIERIMEAAKIEHLLICGAGRSGSSVSWLTGWPVTAEAIGVVSPGLPIGLFVQHFNHVPLAKRLAHAEVEWGGESTIRRTVEELARRGARVGRVGVMGILSYTQHDILAARYGRAIDLNAAYARLRLVKSAEEIEWMRLGAAMSDRAMSELRDGIKPGLTEHDLVDIVERAYVPLGGRTLIHYLGATSMESPDLAVPRQFPSGRRIVKGDIVMAEISAQFWDYPGQILRSFSVGVDPPPLYKKLHKAADAALQSILGILKAGTTAMEVVEAAAVIEEQGFTTVDDLVHGFGGGYLPPVLGSKSRPAGPIPDFRFGAGMTLVVQPNVVTREGNAGVQTGELVLVGEKGVERLHQVPRGFVRV